MARAIKKVRGKNFFTSKLFFGICSGVLLALIATIITLFIVDYYKSNTEDENNVFNEEKFIKYKENYSNLDDIINGSLMHNFIFLYSSKDFDVEENTQHKKIKEALEKFIFSLEARNEAEGEEFIGFYMIDVSLVGNENAVSDIKLGALGEVPALVYIYGESYTPKTPNIEDDAKKEIIAGNQQLESIINNANGYVQTLAN